MSLFEWITIGITGVCILLGVIAPFLPWLDHSAEGEEFGISDYHINPRKRK